MPVMIQIFTGNRGILNILARARGTSKILDVFGTGPEVAQKLQQGIARNSYPGPDFSNFQ